MYRWVDHTAELELELEAATERDVLSDALAALRELLEREGTEFASTPARPERPAAHASAALDHGAHADAPLQRRVICAAAKDRPALLAAWLEELLFLSESAGFIPLRVEQLSLDAGGLRAIVAGRAGEPRPLVKAATYHRLQFEPSDGGYRARVVFDV